jgi:hypothetical protein
MTENGREKLTVITDSHCLSEETNVGSGESHAVTVGQEYIFLLTLNSFVLFAGSGAESVLPVEDGFVDTEIFIDARSRLPVSDFMALAREKVGMRESPPPIN